MLKQIIKAVLFWRLATILVAALAVYFLPVKDCCQAFGGNLGPSYLANIWANFAGRDFLDLARFGYGLPLPPSTYVYFPLFPAAINLLTKIIPDYLASGLVLSHVSLVLALYYLYRLVKLDFKEPVARNTLLLLLLFPTAFFFGSVYTESFFLLLAVLTFYFARRQRFFPAGLLALFASATRFAGIFLWPALAWELWQGHPKRAKKEGLDSTLVWLILPPLGLFAYMKQLLIQTGDPLMFLRVSPSFGPNIVVNKLILLHQVFFRYAKMALGSELITPLYLVILLEFAVGILFLILAIIAFKKLRPSYAVYTLLAYLTPTLTGTFAGLPRYVLTIFPGFILLALWYSRQRPFIQKIYLAINVIIGISLIALFTRGYFVG